MLWAGTDDGNVWKGTGSADGFPWEPNNNWEKMKIKGIPKNVYVTQIIADENGQDVWIVANNYRQNDWAPYLWHSSNAGESWENLITDNIKGHSLSFAQDPINEDLCFWVQIEDCIAV